MYTQHKINDGSRRLWQQKTFENSPFNTSKQKHVIKNMYHNLMHFSRIKLYFSLLKDIFNRPVVRGVIAENPRIKKIPLGRK